MRPQAIVHFEIIAIIALVLNQILNFLTREQMAAILGVSTSFTLEAVIFVLSLGLILWASRLASNLARWLIIIITVVGYLLVVLALPEIIALGSIIAFSLPAIAVLQFASIYFLLCSDGRSWFQK